MSAVEEFVLKIPKLYRLLIVVGVACLLFVGYYFFWVADWMGKVAGTQGEITTIEGQIASEENIAKNKPKLVAQIKKLEKDLKQEVASLPEQKEIEQLLRRITDLLSETNLVQSRFVPGQETVNEELYYATIPVQIQVAGDYVKQWNFLSRLHGLERIINVPKISLSKLGGKMSGREGEVATALGISNLDADIQGVTYRRLNDREIEMIQAKKKAQKGQPAAAKRR
ncbi:MAG: type 4a pilus biogenesis protein PilO [Thermodesulfobacteriota bacterium]